MTEPELEIELDAPALPVVTHRTRRVWIVGEDPAAAEARVRTQVAQEIAAFVEKLFHLLDQFTVDTRCDFDHDGGCQEHGFISLHPGERCPNAEARELIDARQHAAEPTADPEPAADAEEKP